MRCLNGPFCFFLASCITQHDCLADRKTDRHKRKMDDKNTTCMWLITKVHWNCCVYTCTCIYQYYMKMFTLQTCILHPFFFFLFFLASCVTQHDCLADRKTDRHKRKMDDKNTTCMWLITKVHWNCCVYTCTCIYQYYMKMFTLQTCILHPFFFFLFFLASCVTQHDCSCTCTCMYRNRNTQCVYKSTIVLHVNTCTYNVVADLSAAAASCRPEQLPLPPDDE